MCPALLLLLLFAVSVNEWKLLGAGSSGFMVFYVPPNKQEDVIDALSGYLHVPFKFETEGSHIVYFK